MLAIDPMSASFHHWVPDLDAALRDALDECMGAQRAAFALTTFVPDPDALEHVSEQALADVLQHGDHVSDLRTNPALGDCLVFHTRGLPGSVEDSHVVELRVQVDTLVEGYLREQVRGLTVERALPSGHYRYPPGSYMGWHTNDRVPGWRAYLTWAAEPERSFFRYRDRDGTVVTSWDHEWDLRVFAIDDVQPFWHTVHSSTDRFSFGYRVITDA